LKGVFDEKDCPFDTLEDIDFKPMTDYYIKKDEERKNRSKEEKKAEKDKRLELIKLYGHAIVDDRIENVSKFETEPPGIFHGRGEHPLIGTLKRRIWPDDVTINISESATPPICQMPGMAWGQVVHRHGATWLASYKGNTEQNNIKYLFLDDTSKFKAESDKKKYEKARRLKSYIEAIRRDYTAKIQDTKSVFNNQLGTATYLIDILALRVGNEKGEDEADTVGCCSLRVEHITFEEDNKITLEFLAKDSMKYKNTVKVDEKVYQNLRKFVVGKKPDGDLFDLINSTKLNEYLKSIMPDLSAKVFRTYNASITLQNMLNKLNESKVTTVEARVQFYNDANREVAILCNHQRTAPKNFTAQLEKVQEQLNEKIQQRKELADYVNALKKGKKPKKVTTDIKLPKTAKQGTAQLEKLDKSISSMENKLKAKEANKEVALGTSKINYMDPRISISWCKDKEVPIEKIFPKTLRSKFFWAMQIEPTWQF